ncbi:MAG: energy-coupling factor ABC transporter ATP-binding protein [Betaproteobacteria bacterium]
MTRLLQAEALVVARGERRVLDGVSLAVAPGERVFIDGASGAGKSTLPHALLGLVPLGGGAVHLLGQRCAQERDFAPLRGAVGLLFQDPDDQLLGPTVFEDVEFGPLNLGLARAQAHQAAHAALARVGIEHLHARPVHELSGGEKRLAALAGVLAMQPKLLLLDEPTSGLDDDASALVLEVLAGTGLPMLAATHDARCVARLATRVLRLRDGRIANGAAS